jgi:hypothetical protein
MGVFIGLDVSLSKTAVCVIDRDGAVLWQGKVPSEPDPLITRLAEWSGPIDLAGIERARCQNGCTAGCAKPASPSASVSRNLLGAGQCLSPYSSASPRTAHSAVIPPSTNSRAPVM